MGLAITSIGMMTSVGRDAVTACASIRAGLTRPDEVEYFEAVDAEEQTVEPALGHPIRGYTDGFFLMARWLRMAEGCLQDMHTTGRLPEADDAAFWQHTGLMAVLPPGQTERFGTQDDEPQLLREAFLPRLRAVAEFPFRESEAVTVAHAGTAFAVRQAAQYIAEGRLQRMVILAVDSYLDPLTLAWLSEQNRMKSATNPAGLSPGEAAACVLVESENSCRQRGAQPLARITGMATGREEHHWGHEEINAGVGLAQAWAEAFQQGGAATPFAGEVITDLNGETWRAYELGCAQMRLQEVLGPAPDVNYLCPAVSLGDTGAASGAVGLCLAVHAFQRGYARGTHAFVLSSSDAGHVGSICLTGANQTNQ